MPGDGLTHGPPATKKQAAATTGLARSTRHSLHDGFNGFLRTLPGDRAFLPRRLRDHLATLASASGGQDHTTSPSASATFVLRAIRVHRIPRLTYRDDRPYVPLHRGGMREKMVLICPTPQARTDAADWHDGQFVHGAHAEVACRESERTRTARPSQQSHRPDAEHRQ
jgi:hypothetical protein